MSDFRASIEQRVFVKKKYIRKLEEKKLMSSIPVLRGPFSIRKYLTLLHNISRIRLLSYYCHGAWSNIEISTLILEHYTLGC